MENEQFPTREELESAVEEPVEPIELESLSPEEKVIGAKLLPILTAKISQEAEARKAKKLAEEVERLKAANEKMMQDEIQKLRDSQKPPDPKQLEQLLTQEYGEMEVPIKGKSGPRTFLIRELPQEAEKRLVAIVQKHLVPHLKELAAVEWTASTTTAQKYQRVIDIVPSALDMMAECCAICLDPYTEEGITPDWVQKNMGSLRILNVIEAQMTVSRFRDFISAAYRLFPQ